MNERRNRTSDAPSSLGFVEALEESESRYRTLFEQSPIGVFTFDRQRCINDCNLALVRLLNSTYEKLVGLDIRTLDDPRLLLAVERVLEGEPLYFEGTYKARLSDAEICMATWLTPLRSADGDVTGGLGLIEDVTLRRATQNALARSEANFRTLIEQAPDAVGVFGKKGEPLYVNLRLAQYLGFERDATSSTTVRDLLHPDDRGTFADRNRRRERGDSLPPAEYRLLHRDGRVLHGEITSMTVQFDGGPAVLVMIRDLTERKRMQAQLLLSDRLASVGVLAAGIAHEINNPLAYVMANLDVLSRKELPELRARVRDDDAQSCLARIGEMLDQARDGAERVRKIVRDVKTFARGDDTTREPVDVHACLDAALQLVSHELRTRARVVRDFAPVPKVEGSESRLGQVFLNLLVNALQALPHTGDNEVRARVSAPDEGTVMVEIADTGEGIAPDVLSRVFDPFFTTKPVGVGTGLGLFVCQGIVSSFGGTLTIESKLGEGTTVRVSLPAVKAPSDQAPSMPPSSRYAGGRVSRVLIVDDEPSLARALATALGDEHEVICVTSGAAAADLLRADDRFDAVLCDLMMPDVSGVDVWSRVREANPDLANRFVFVTGGVFSPDMAAFLEQGKTWLEKPFDMPQLRSLLRRMKRP